jgi:hypothetical protein
VKIGISSLVLVGITCLMFCFFDSATGILFAKFLGVTSRSFLTMFLIGMLACIPLAILGIVLDKKKIPAIVALLAIFPLLVFMGMWDGHW